jgi:hypothetical protein
MDEIDEETPYAWRTLSNSNERDVRFARTAWLLPPEDQDQEILRWDQNRRMTNEMFPEEGIYSMEDALSDLVGGYEEDQLPAVDELRARVVIDGLDPVPKHLLSRFESVRSGGDRLERALCVVCYEPLALVYDQQREPIQTRNIIAHLHLHHHPAAAPTKVVAFPCLHLFHSDCLMPWLALKTTCPTCRFDVDKDSLTLRGGSLLRPWVPPAKGVLEKWVKDEEKKKRLSIYYSTNGRRHEL